MEENYFATSRNRHELKDMYNPETNTLDIRSNGLYPSNVLSNLCSNGFRFDGMICGSMEGFLQSLKRQDNNKQRQICSMKGGNARKIRLGCFRNWHRAVVRRAAYGEATSDFPVSLLTSHPDINLKITEFVAALD